MNPCEKIVNEKKFVASHESYVKHMSEKAGKPYKDRLEKYKEHGRKTKSNSKP